MPLRGVHLGGDDNDVQHHGDAEHEAGVLLDVGEGHGQKRSQEVGIRNQESATQEP